MMWYGLIFYFGYLFLLFFLIIYLLRQFSIFTFFSIQTFTLIIREVFNFLLFFLLMNLLILYAFYENNFYLVQNTNFVFLSSLINNQSHWISFTLTSEILFIYYIPFIYIFLIITLLSIFYTLTYNFNELGNFLLYILIILLFGYILFWTDSLVLFFLAYEMLLLPSFFILYRFAKTRRSIEAAYLMFFWTQFGAFFLIFSFLYLFFICNTSLFSSLLLFPFSTFEINFLFICWIIGFGVKLPIWPFYGWLPKAHVEASTNFSIFLSGVLVKFAFFGLFKCLTTIQLEPTYVYVYPFLFVGLVDAVFKLFYQIDLKKLVAYSTVVEMHWLTITILNSGSGLFLAGFCMLISHAFLSTNSFLLVDCINRRFKTRLLTELGGLNWLTPKLFLLILANLLIFLGFPGTIFFIAELLFFSFLFDLFPLFALILIVLLYLLGPTFFFRSWWNVCFGASSYMHKRIPVDLDLREFWISAGLLLIMFWLGLSWQCFLF
jgi:NADH-quinone oxidoreductase subunit M